MTNPVSWIILPKSRFFPRNRKEIARLFNTIEARGETHETLL
jgi:hypothetical protein